VAGVDELAERFRAQATTALPRAPLFSSMCAAIAERPDLVRILAAAPDEQQSPVLLLAAVHDRVLADPGCELGAWFPTVVPDPLAGDVAPVLARFVALHADELHRIVTTRNTQTNEVGRCGLLVPALGLLAAEVGPLALVDVGSSAGLNLLLDRYEYEYVPGGHVGAPSAVHLEVGTRGAVPVPAELPPIAVRIGLDRHPVDLADADAVRWLRACVWPDQRDRLARLDAALAVAAGQPAEVLRGDAVADLAGALAAVSGAGHPVVVNTWVLSYLTGAERRAYHAELHRIGTMRDLSWVFAESPAQTPGLPHPVELADQHVTALGMVRWRGGRATSEHLGIAHPHGYWLHWARGARAGSDRTAFAHHQ
jgi:hypothetical protein